MKNKTRMMILAALFAALTAVGAFIRFPLGTMSVTLQFMFTAMAGVLLGANGARCRRRYMSCSDLSACRCSRWAAA